LMGDKAASAKPALLERLKEEQNETVRDTIQIALHSISSD